MGTHPIFESDFDCLTECPPVTLKLATQPQPSIAKLWLMASSKMSALINSKANMLSSFFTHLTSPSSAQPKLLPFLKPLPNSRKSIVKLLLLQRILSSLIGMDKHRPKTRRFGRDENPNF